MKVKITKHTGKVQYLIVFLFNFIQCNAQPGTIDNTFNIGTGANLGVFASAIQTDGKILIGGPFTTYNGTSTNRIARINTNGSIDASFNIGSGANDAIEAIAIQDDGKIIIGGWVTSYNGITVNKIARLNTDGSLDNTFNPGMGPDSNIFTLSIQNDGKIIVGGAFINFNGVSANHIVRLNTNGSVDNSFITGFGAGSSVWTTTIQNDGKIIIGGEFWWYDATMIQKIARINTDGSIDATFSGPYLGPNSDVLTTSIQNDGKIIIGGLFSDYNGVPRNSIARINSDGTLDNSFNPGSGGTIWFIRGSAVQNDGRVLIGGSFENFNSSVINNFVRLNSDGSIDSTFIIGSGTNYDVRTFIIQDDNKIVLCGDFTSYNGTTYNNLVRLLNCYPSIDTLNISICSGDSILLSGSYQTNSGFFYDSLLTVNGCDSIIVTNLTVNPAYSINNPQTIYDGDSVQVDGHYYYFSGIYYDTLTTTTGCDSVIITDITVVTYKLSDINGATGDTLHVPYYPYTLDAGTGFQDYLWSNGGNNQQTQVYNDGWYSVTVTYTSKLILSDSLYVHLITNSNLNELTNSNILIHPNPTSKYFFVKILGIIEDSYTITLYDTQGKTVDIITTQEQETVIDISKYPQGVYWIRVLGNNIVRSEKIIKLMTN